MDDLVPLCGAQHKRTYVVSEIMLWALHLPVWVSIRVVGNITNEPIAARPRFSLRMWPGVNAQTGPGG